MLALLLQSSAHSTATASTGREAIQQFKVFRPDVALLDISMPDIDGYELCQRLRATPGGENTLFLAQSGWRHSKYREKALAMGFREHFVKPLVLAQLTGVLQQYTREVAQQRNQE